MTFRMHSYAIVFLGLVVALGIAVFAFFPNLWNLAKISFAESSSYNPAWLIKAGEGWTAPACGSATQSSTCVGGYGQIAISWSYIMSSGTHGYTSCQANANIPGLGSTGWTSCSNSATFSNLPSNTTYNYSVDFLLDAVTTESVSGSITTPSCIPPPPGPACSNNNDDDGDGVADANDPGCHTDGDPDNPGSHDPNDNDESNPPSGGGGTGSAIINTLDALPRLVNKGGTSSLTWSTSGDVASCQLTANGSVVSTATSASNWTTPTLSESTLFELTCTGGNGNIVKSSVMVRINPNIIEE